MVYGQSTEGFRVSVSVDLVVLQATVQDRKGGFASDLGINDFDVHEDGVRQSVSLFRHEDMPVTIGLVIDHSGSMARKLADVIQAARTFVQASSPADEMFVVNFNEHVSVGLPDSIPFTNKAAELARAISGSQTTGQTALYDAITVALKRLQTGTRDKKVLIVISDGGDNASVHTLAQVLLQAEASNAIVYTIGIFDDSDPDRNPGVLRRLARTTGGQAFFPAKPEDVVGNCERIARDIRSQYTLGYVPGSPALPGVFRAIQVTARGANGRKFDVRTRSGYIAGSHPSAFKAETAK